LFLLGQHPGRVAIELERKARVILNSTRNPQPRTKPIPQPPSNCIALILRIRKMSSSAALPPAWHHRPGVTRRSPDSTRSQLPTSNSQIPTHDASPEPFPRRVDNRLPEGDRKADSRVISIIVVVIIIFTPVTVLNIQPHLSQKGLVTPPS
jgi:hypothetical protein